MFFELKFLWEGLLRKLLKERDFQLEQMKTPENTENNEDFLPPKEITEDQLKNEGWQILHPSSFR